jgi:putative membrane protein
MTDKKFVKTAMQGSMVEIKLGQLASQNGGSEEVKQFGQRMVEDHTKLSEQMKPIASQLGVTPPDDEGAMHKALAKKLQGKTGAEFDKEYMQAMVKDHEKDLSEFQKEASSGKSQAVKDAASQGAPIIQEHLKMAQQISQKVSGSGASTSAASSNGGGF